MDSGAERNPSSSNLSGDGLPGRQFHVELLQNDLPDSVVPFPEFAESFPVVFRLPLRTSRSAHSLDGENSIAHVQADFSDTSEYRFFLLFTQHLPKLRFEFPEPSGRSKWVEYRCEVSSEDRANLEQFVA
jgi:hypothetical protein